MKRITQFILCLALAVSAYGQGVGGNSVPRTVSGISNALDLISSTQGSVFYRGASGWEALTPGTSGQLLSTQGAAANPIWVTATGGAGDMNGPASATDNAIVRFDGTGGKTVQNSAVTIADTTGAMTWAAGQDASFTAGSSGASLVLGSGASGAVTVYPKGLSSMQVSNGSTIGSVVLGGGGGNAELYADGSVMIVSSFGARPIQFYLNGAEKARFVATTGDLSLATTSTATAVNTGGLRSANFGLSTVSGGASYFEGKVSSNARFHASAAGSGFWAGTSDLTLGFYEAAGAMVFRTSGINQLTLAATTGAATFAGAVTTSSATLSGAGAIPITTSLVKFTSTDGAQALTLKNGVDGQRLTIVHDVEGGSGVLTPTTKTGFSTITFTNAGDTVSLVYVTTRGWMVTGSYGVTIAP